LVSDAHTTEDQTEWGRPAGSGNRAHEPVLDLPDGAWAEGRDGRDQGRRFRRRVL